MDKKIVLEFLSNISFFKGFTSEEKNAIADLKGVFLKFRPKEFIIREGETDATVFLILKGSVLINKKDLPDIIISRLRAGSLFGEISLISDRPRSTNVVAETEAVAMKITKEMIEGLELPLQKKFQDRMIKILAQRLDEMNEKYIQVLENPMTT